MSIMIFQIIVSYIRLFDKILCVIATIFFSTFLDIFIELMQLEELPF